MKDTTDRLLWLATAAMLVLAAARSSPAPIAEQPVVHEGRNTVPREVVSESLSVLAEGVVANDPFRLSNTPPKVRYTIAQPPSRLPPGPAPKPPKPTLSLRGILGGPPWQAILDGLPGAPPATVVRVGDRVGVLLIKEIGLNAVVVSGPDTTWRLAMGSRRQ